MFFLFCFNTNIYTSGLWSTGKTRKYHQIYIYIYQCEHDVLVLGFDFDMTNLGVEHLFLIIVLSTKIISLSFYSFWTGARYGVLAR